MITIEGVSPPPFVIKISNPTGDDRVTIHSDGSVELAEGANINAAAKLFWSAVKRYAPARCACCRCACMQCAQCGNKD